MGVSTIKRPAPRSAGLEVRLASPSCNGARCSENQTRDIAGFLLYVFLWVFLYRLSYLGYPVEPRTMVCAAHYS